MRFKYSYILKNGVRQAKAFVGHAESPIKRFKLLSSAAFATTVFSVVACSPVKFSKDPTVDPCQNFKETCIVQEGWDTFNYSVSVGGGKTDILIVDDNSASMSFEQTKLAQRFSGFIQRLDSRGIDYRIAITTTDISNSENGPRTINQNGALQDGNLIPFSDGSRYLTPSNSNRVSLFNSAIQRPETNACEQFIANWVSTKGSDSRNSNEYATAYKQNCPSNDERGIYAANLVLERNPVSFLRADAHTAVIFLSDEDERSNGANWDPNWDTAYSLVDRFDRMYASSKSLSVHSIIVKDANCLAIQSNQVLGNPQVEATRGTAPGQYGTLYKQFSDSGWGILGDICASDADYTSQLGDIATSIGSKVDMFNIACANPSDLTVVVASNDPTLSWSLVGKTIKFNKVLPAQTNVNLSYKCKKL